MVAIDALSRARTPGTSSTDLEMTGTAGLGVFVAKEWIGKVFEVQRVSNRIILVKLIVGQHVNTILEWSSDEIKDLFFDSWML